MKIKSAKSFRYWYKTKIKEIDRGDLTHNENFVGTYRKENGKKTIKGFFEMYHGDKPDIASYLPSILKIAEDGQAIYEFLQNAVDCGSTHFYIFYNEKHFLAINNGSPFDIEGLQSILNIAQTTKKDPDKIGRFGIGFKLAHRLVGKNEGTNELVNQYKGPILFSWAKLEHLESLLNSEQIEPIAPPKKGTDNGFFDAPYLLKILLTNFPTDPNETVKDINYKDQILFRQEELRELIEFLNENFKIHSDSLKKNVLKQGSLFFIKLGEDKKKLLDKDYSELVNGIQYSMNTLKNLQKVYINSDDIGKTPLQLEVGTIKTGSEEYQRISPEYNEFDIKYAIGFNTINFGNEKSYEQIKLLKEKPNFYKYFPMGDEINGFSFIVHCDSFSNEANRRKLHEDDVNRNLFPELAKHIINRISKYKVENRDKFLNIYASLLLSDIPDRQNNKWLRPIFYDPLLNLLQKNIPTKTGYSDIPNNVKINNVGIKINLSDFGLRDIQWFEWDDKADKLLLDEATSTDKLGIEEWEIRDIVENADLTAINDWIANCDIKTYEEFMNELEKGKLRSETKEKICQIKLFKFTNGNYYSINDMINKVPISQSSHYRTNYSYHHKNTNAFFTTPKLEGIREELAEIGIILSEVNVARYPNIFSSTVGKPDEKDTYNFIADKCKTNKLSPEGKKKVFLNFIGEYTRFDNVSDELLKDLHLFSNNDLQIKPLRSLIGDIKVPSWLGAHKINEKEYFPQLAPYLISETDKIFTDIFQPNKSSIINEITTVNEIKTLINLFRENRNHFFTEYIIHKDNGVFSIKDKTHETFQYIYSNKRTPQFVRDNLDEILTVLPYDLYEDCKDELGILKGVELYEYILHNVEVDELCEQLVNIMHYEEPKRNFILRLTELRLCPTREYTIDCYDYKIIEMAIKVLHEDVNTFKNKIIIEDGENQIKLTNIPPFVNTIKIDKYELKLANILPTNYPNIDYVSSLINQFVDLGLNHEQLSSLFGIGQEPEISEIFQMFSEQVEVLENADQLAFAILYDKYFDKIDLTNFKVLSLNGQEYNLSYNFYRKKLDFISKGAILDDRYQGIKKILGNLPFHIDDDIQILDQPYFIENEFVCPDIETDNLTDEQKLSFIEYLFDHWKNNQTVIKNINWQKIDNIDTACILGFNPVSSVYPNEYACESEVLPDYILNWIRVDETRLDFITDLGVWTENTVVVELRKCLSGEIDEFQSNRLAQEIKFNENETNLFNSFEWLKQMNYVLHTQSQYETFIKVTDIINYKRDTRLILKIEEEYDLTELQEHSIEWEVVGDYRICLYDGLMPIIVKLDEIHDYIFYNYKDDEYVVDSNVIYINSNKDFKDTLQKVASDDNNGFTFKDLWSLFEERENVRIEDDAVIENPFKDITPDDETFIRGIIKGDFELNEKLDANTTAKIKTLIAIKGQYNASEIIDEGRFLKAGSDEIIVRSAQNGLLYLDVYHWGRLSESNVSLSIYTKSQVKIFKTQEDLLEHTKPQNKFGIVRMPNEYSVEDYNSLDNITDKGKWHYIFIVNENTKAAQSYKEIMNLDDYNF